MYGLGTRDMRCPSSTRIKEFSRSFGNVKQVEKIQIISQKEWENWGDAFTHTFTKACNTSFLSRVIQIVTARPRVPRLPKKSFKKICTGHRKREEK